MKNNSGDSKAIALFVPTLGGGGAERVMIMIANGLAAEGLKVDLITGNAEGPYRKSISDKVNLVNFDVPRLLYSIPFFAKYLWINRPKTVLSALGHANLANAFLTRLITRKTRIVVSVHNSLSGELPAKCIPRLMQLLNGWALRRSDHVVSVSQGIRDQLLERYQLEPSRVTAIYNPLDVESISELSAESSGNNWLDRPDFPVVIGVGRLAEQKNFELLIRAFSIVREQVPSRLIILGEGEKRANLENIVESLGLEEDVYMPGFVKNPYAWLSKSSLFVLSSKWEGLPGVLLEALACGAQVVSTDCKTGPREILEEGKWGTLVKTNDQEELANAIIKSLQKEELVDTKVRALDFSKEHAVASYFDILSLDN